MKFACTDEARKSVKIEESSDHNFKTLTVKEGTVPIKMWTKGVLLESEAQKQLINIAMLPFIHDHIAVMPDVHLGMGATVGSVIPTKGAIVPAAVGVDIGCGMVAVRTTLKATDLPDDLSRLRAAIEKAVPHGRTADGRSGDKGAWKPSDLPKTVEQGWLDLLPTYEEIIKKYPKLGKGNDSNHLGTLGTGNHFIEICLDQENRVWFMLHSGSRGVGNRIGSFFISLAKEDLQKHHSNLPDMDLAYLTEGTEHFDDYVQAVAWAQNYAKLNRKIMLKAVIDAATQSGLPPFACDKEAINCHHNYVQKEEHFGASVWVTRKGAVKAGLGDMGIIPGSMGAKSFIVRGKGNPESFQSCSHGAGRAMSRTEAKRRFSVEDHIKATRGIECRKDKDVVDETPAAYKDIDAVMNAQSDLVEIVHTLRQLVCVKG